VGCRAGYRTISTFKFCASVVSDASDSKFSLDYKPFFLLAVLLMKQTTLYQLLEFSGAISTGIASPIFF
jgi:hypothetical protein